MPRAHRNKEALLVTVPMLVQELNINKTKIRKIAEEAGAVYKYGRLVRIDRNKFLNYFFETYAVKNEKKVTLKQSRTPGFIDIFGGFCF